MVAFVGILGVLQIIGGILICILAPTSIQQILGAVLFGMGVIAFALGVLIEKANKQIEIVAKLAAPKPSAAIATANVGMASGSTLSSSTK